MVGMTENFHRRFGFGVSGSPFSTVDAFDNANRLRVVSFFFAKFCHPRIRHHPATTPP
jgi:hypothetical protein